MFITFEGPNGVGKSSIIEAVTKELIIFGVEALTTKEPTESSLGNFLREAEEIYNGECLACIAVADRYFHIKDEIAPALSCDKLIFSDRYIESSLVFQRMDGCTIDFIWNLHQQILIPDLSITLIASPSILEQRLSKRCSFSRFERSHSREEEVRLYLQAAEFISQRGFNVLILTNDISPLNDIVKQIVHKIRNLLHRSGVK